jgi:hypothetical protein
LVSQVKQLETKNKREIAAIPKKDEIFIMWFFYLFAVKVGLFGKQA